MLIGAELRKLAADTLDKFEIARECYKLTLMPIRDMDEVVGFTAWEARPRGWVPVISGTIDPEGELAITYCATTSAHDELELLASFVTELEQPDRFVVEVIPAVSAGWNSPGGS